VSGAFPPPTLPSAAGPAGSGDTTWHLAPEFGPIARQWLLWPCRPDNWREGARPARRAFATLAEAMLAFDPVTIGTPAALLAETRRQIPAGVDLAPVAADDAWLRDSGPAFTRGPHGRRRALAFRFNAWGGADGGLYADWSQDALVASRIADLAGWPCDHVPLVLEGGAIHGDGAGTGLTTASCLLAPNRNPTLTRAGIEATLCAWLGFQRLIWLPEGLAGDETGGHIDNLACFLGPGRVALAETDDPASPHAAACQAARALLESTSDARGQALEIIPIPLPEGVPPMSIAEANGIIPRAGSQPRRPGTPLTASYLNAVFASGAVVIPAFGVATDERARRAWASALPGREVIALPAREILLGGGGLHCVTLSEPG